MYLPSAISLTNSFTKEELRDWICPDLTPYWRLGRSSNSNQVVLQAIQGDRRWWFSAAEGLALQYFTGKFTVEQIQNLCRQQLSERLPASFLVELLQKLIELEILALGQQSDRPLEEPAPPPSPSSPQNFSSPRLKAGVQSIKHPDGYWILRNPEDLTFLQVDDRSQQALAQLGQMPLGALAQQHQLTPDELRYLLQLLAATAMLEGTKPAQPPKRKFTPLQLISFTIRLFNPDPWLTKHIDQLGWIWTPAFCLTLCFFLGWATTVGLSQGADIFRTGKQLWMSYGGTLILPFALLSMLVVTLHELGHAFTLKHYGGIVPEVGLRFMCFIPSAYTNTTDAYCLVKRRQRVLVVAAGILVQFIIAALALCLWHISASETWLSTTSYLLMAAALFTVALNLNPLSKFDGYYLAVALSGINNLRSRSFGLYVNLLRWRPTQEKLLDALILAAYAPFSLLYTLLVFGSLFGLVITWLLTYIPAIASVLLAIWIIYFFWPSSPNRSASP